MVTTKSLGDAAEKLAMQFLHAKGWRCQQRNFQCRYGEIDLIMQDTKTLVFVEVRLRKNSSYGSGIESVTVKKQQKLIKTAQYYLQRHNISLDTPMRFDVIGINSNQQIEWIENAF